MVFNATRESGEGPDGRGADRMLARRGREEYEVLHELQPWDTTYSTSETWLLDLEDGTMKEQSLEPLAPEFRKRVRFGRVFDRTLHVKRVYAWFDRDRLVILFVTLGDQTDARRFLTALRARYGAPDRIQGLRQRRTSSGSWPDWAYVEANVWQDSATTIVAYNRTSRNFAWNLWIFDRRFNRDLREAIHTVSRQKAERAKRESQKAKREGEEALKF